VAISLETRDIIRNHYHLCCGYCGVSEIEVGGPLEVDHFQPLSHGGTDELGNLVYACTGCNRFKGDYWPVNDTSPHLHLLHPGQDNLISHITETADGHLIGMTQQGWFHIHWLRLNRPQLVLQRQKRYERQYLEERLAITEAINQQLAERIRSLEQEIRQMLALIRQLTQRNP
jgi:hypothetical protein